ncbi:MAG: hypothetical protein V3U73_14870 [bacterium]
MRICSGTVRFTKSWWILSAAALVLSSSVGQADSSGRAIPRKVLALYKGSEGTSEEQNKIYFWAQLPLNNLGLVVEYANAEESLPDPEQLQEYRGVISWFNTVDMKYAHRYRAWLRKILQSGKRVVVLGNLGAYREYQKGDTDFDEKEVKEIFGLLGLKTNLMSWKNQRARFDRKDLGYFDYEAQLDPKSLRLIHDIRSDSPENKVLLSMVDDGKESHPAVLTSVGGYIQAGAVCDEDTTTHRAQWYVNPTKFFSEAYECEDLPVADLNTTGGFRTAFIHVDGDGFSTISKIDRWHLCADLVKNRVLKNFSFPFSVSVIAGEIDSAYLGNVETIKSAREIFRLRNVEPASHGFAHPQDWKEGELSLDIGKGYSYDPMKEAVGSVNYIRDKLLPDGKNVNLMFWTGMCNPNQDVIDMVEERGWLQMNGGAGALDLERPSISNFYPPYGQTGDRKRINSRISNEFEFTNGWLGPLDGYKDVIHSLEFTGGPNPIVPANIYFHYYILEWEEGWQSLRQVLKWAEQQDWTFVYASDYAASVKDFLEARFIQRNPDEYEVITNGALRTVRFRNEQRNVDVSQSVNVTGFIRKHGDLLVHLDSHKSHRIALGENKPSVPYLNQANQIVDSLEARPEATLLFVHGYGRLSATLSGLKPDSYFSIETRPLLPSGNEKAMLQATAFSTGSLIPSEKQYVYSLDDGTLSIDSFITGASTVIITSASSFNYHVSQAKYWMFLVVVFGFVWLQLSRARITKFKELGRIIGQRISIRPNTGHSQSEAKGKSQLDGQYE